MTASYAGVRGLRRRRRHANKTRACSDSKLSSSPLNTTMVGGVLSNFFYGGSKFVFNPNIILGVYRERERERKFFGRF